MRLTAKYLFMFLLVGIFFSFTGCSEEEDVRTPADIIGIWQSDENSFYEFKSDYVAKPFHIEYQDGESIGKWGLDDVFYYDPGYNIVIYITSEHEANVYQIIELTDKKLTWCWVEKVETNGGDSVGNIIGNIINDAQAGFQLDPALYQSFTRISEEDFLSILDGLDLILNPWEY